MEFRYGHLVDFATQDERGKMILVGIFDLVHVPRGNPLAMPPATLVVSLRASVLEGTRHTIELRLSGPDGEDVVERQSVTLDFAPDFGGLSLAANLRFELRGLVLQSFGDHVFRVYAGDAQLGEVGFAVIPIEPPAA
jgi:hypothetical protein